MEYTEDDYLMISGIQHFKFCRRQWALIHVEQQWAENVHTAVGKLMHQKVHDPYLTEKRKDTILVRALPVSSRIMGVSGECDLVEFHKCEDGIRLHGHRGMYSVYPVEYKKGKSKSTDADRLQLVAQALCLEEIFDQCKADIIAPVISAHRKIFPAFSMLIHGKTIHDLHLFFIYHK